MPVLRKGTKAEEVHLILTKIPVEEHNISGSEHIMASSSSTCLGGPPHGAVTSRSTGLSGLAVR